MKKISLWLLLCFIGIINLLAQDPINHIETFFNDYQKVSPEVALKNVCAENPWLVKDTVVVNNWSKKLTRRSNNLGKYCGYEIIETNKTGSSFIEYVCFVKHEKAPYKIAIVLYKPKETWRVNNVILSRGNTQNKRKK